jgi:uncharacterized protein (TIGR02270 family)
MGRDCTIRWDVLEEHLAEAAFLYGQWERSLRSATLTLADVEAGFEERLRAHLAGLILAGDAAREELLVPALASDDPGSVFAAAFALAAARPAPAVDPVLAALGTVEPAQAAAARRALALAPAPDLAYRLAAAVGGAAPAVQAQAVAVLADLRVDPGFRLDALASSSDAAVEALALRAGRAFPGQLDPQLVTRGLASEDADVRVAALETALVLGLPVPPNALDAVLEAEGAAFERGALLAALAAPEAAVERLAPALADPERKRAAAFALGFTGLASVADALVAAISRDSRVAIAAADALARIAGVGIEGRLAAPPDALAVEDEADAELEPPAADAALPAPDAGAVARWWSDARGRFEGRQRWLRGAQWDDAAVLAELEAGPCRGREGLALDLAIRTRGEAAIAWDAFGARQRADLARARAGRSIAAGTPAQPTPRRPPARAATPGAHAWLRTDLVVTAAGMISSVGFDVRQSAAAVRAGVTRARECADIYSCLGPEPRFDDPEPLVACPIEHVGPRPRSAGRRVDWLACLAGGALRDLARQAKLERLDPDLTGLFVSAPGEREGWGPAEREQLGIMLHDFAAQDLVRHVEIADEGHGGALRLVERADALLRSGEIRMAVVGGVDSWLFPPWLEALDRVRRLRSTRSVTGFTPGEGAAFFLLETPAQAASRGGTPRLRVRGLASGRAEGAPRMGEALAAVLAPLAEAAGVAPVLFCDLNGETARTREWGWAQARLGRALQAGFAVEHPAIVLGDLGAASGATLVALAAELLPEKYPERPAAVVWTASDDGNRRAMLLERM